MKKKSKIHKKIIIKNSPMKKIDPKEVGKALGAEEFQPSGTVKSKKKRLTDRQIMVDYFQKMDISLELVKKTGLEKIYLKWIKAARKEEPRINCGLHFADWSNIVDDDDDMDSYYGKEYFKIGEIMTEQEFIDQIKSLGVPVYAFEKRKNTRYFDDSRPSNIKPSEVTIDSLLFCEWRTGGDTGGSCWDTGDRSPSPVSGEPEPEFEALDAILNALCPNITYLKYKKLIADGLVEYDDYTQNEYYGNYYTYGTKKVYLKKLYNKMIELELL